MFLFLLNNSSFIADKLNHPHYFAEPYKVNLAAGKVEGYMRNRGLYEEVYTGIMCTGVVILDQSYT